MRDFAGRLAIERCISNRKSRRPVVCSSHETTWNPGGVGRTAAAGGAASSSRQLTVRGGADGGCSGQRRVAVARDGQTKGRQGPSSTAGAGTSTKAYVPTTAALAETARRRGAGLRVP